MTLKPIDAIQKTTTSLSPITHQLPEIFSKSMKVICTVHSFWRGARTARAARDTPSFGLYVSGLGINLAFGDRKGIKIAAQAVLIALRVVECIEHYVALQLCYEELINEFQGHAIIPLKLKWKTPKGFVFLSPSIHHAVVWECKVKCERVKRIACIIARMTYHLFDLSMCMLDASKALSLDNEHVSDNINEIFLNGLDLWNKLTNDLPFLQEKLTEHSVLIDTLISNTTRSPMKTCHLLKVCTLASDLRQAAGDAVNAIVSVGQAAIGTQNQRKVDHLKPKERFIDDVNISKPQWVNPKLS